MLDFTGWWCQNKKTALPGSPCDRDAMSRINAEGKHVGDHSSFLYGGCGSAAVWHGVEISIESAAVQLHKIQDGCSQFLHNCHWKEKKKNRFCCLHTNSDAKNYQLPFSGILDSHCTLSLTWSFFISYAFYFHRMRNEAALRIHIKTDRRTLKVVHVLHKATVLPVYAYLRSQTSS